MCRDQITAVVLQHSELLLEGGQRSKLSSGYDVKTLHYDARRDEERCLFVALSVRCCDPSSHSQGLL